MFIHQSARLSALLSSLLLPSAFSQRTLAEFDEALERQEPIQIYDSYGHTVAMNSRFAFIGGWNVTQARTGVDGGVVEVFVRVPGGWQLVQRLEPAVGNAFDQFGWSLSSTEERLAVGAPLSDELGFNTGSIYVYRESGGTWQLEQQVLPLCTTRSGFGNSVSLVGDTMVVSGYADACTTPNVNQDGAVYVYERHAGGWTLTDVLKAPGLFSFGHQVATDGEWILASCLQRRPNVVFHRTSSGWTETQRLSWMIPTFCNDIDDAAAFEGDLMAVGATCVSSATNGVVNLFRLQGTQWVHETTLFSTDPHYTPTGSAAGDQFGRSVAIHDGQVLVGSPFASPVNGAPLQASGAVHLFEKINGTWRELMRLDAPVLQFGAFLGHLGVALNDGVILAGAPGDTIPGIGWSGNAYTYWRNLGALTCVGEPNSTGDAATLRVTGATEAAAAIVEARASGLPPHAATFFLASRTTAQVVHPGNSQGTLCLGGAIARIGSSIGTATAEGTHMATLDATSIPSPSGPTPIQAGETWTFQGWYRDSNPHPTSNFTEARTMLFR
jgi:hypothetical protein